MANKTVAAQAAAVKAAVVHEFVLYRRAGDDRVALLSDPDLDVVKQARVNAIAGAIGAGQARPELFIEDRKCTYPLKNGKRQAEGSTCEESEV